jgi:hypothetical protein
LKISIPFLDWIIGSFGLFLGTFAGKPSGYLSIKFAFKHLIMKRDSLVFDLINEEEDRQKRGIELIASKNFTSKQVMVAC